MILASQYGSFASQKGVEELPPNTQTTLYDNNVVGTGLQQNNYTGTWTLGSSNPGDYQNTIHYSNITNDQVTFQFTGVRVEWISELYTSHGKVEVSIDGVVMTIVDQYAPGATPTFQQVLYTSPIMSQGLHTIVLRVTGTKNAASSNFYLVHDAFKVYSTEVPATGSFNWYVSPTGSNAAAGTESAPFQTIAKAASVALPGHKIAIRAGTYREGDITPATGTIGNPIRFLAYPGETAIISGLNTVNTSWQVHSGNIYKTTISLPVTGFSSSASFASNTDIKANQIFKDGDMQIEARWPKGVKTKDNLFDMTATTNLNTSAWRHFSNFGTGNQIQNNNLQDNQLLTANGFPIPNGDLVNKTIVVQGWFFTGSATITAHSSNSITFSPSMWANNSNDQQFRKYYYLTGDLRFLSQEREFHYESGTLYYWQPGGGSPTNVEYKARNWAFNLSNKSYISLEGLTFVGCEPATGNYSTTFCTIDNIRASFMNHHVTHPLYVFQGHGSSQYMGLGLKGASNIVKNSEFQWASSQGVWIGENGRVENNKFTSIAYDGMWGCPVAYWGLNGSGQNVGNSNIKVLYNTMSKLGRGGIDNGFAFAENDSTLFYYPTRNNEVGYNNIYDFCKLNQDGGAFYSWGYQNLSGCRFHHNWIHDLVSFRPPNGDLTDGIMAGIYFDMGSGADVGESQVVVDHNVFWSMGPAGSGSWNPNEISDIYTKPEHQSGSKPGKAAKRPNLLYNNTCNGDQKSYTTYQSVVADVFKNNIFRKEVNRNWGGNPATIDSTNLQSGTNPLFNGGSLTTPEIYHGLQAGSTGLNIGSALPPYTDGSSGNPDAGAYERGVTPWTAGYVAVPYDPILD